MAKFTVTYKWPEWDESVQEAKHKIPAGDVERVCDKFDIGEYLTLELDTVAMTCVVKQRGKVGSDKHYTDITEEWQAEKDEEEAEKKAFNKALREARREEKKAGVDKPNPHLAEISEIVTGSINRDSQWLPDKDGNLRTPISFQKRFIKV